MIMILYFLTWISLCFSTTLVHFSATTLALLALRIQHYVKAPLECASVSWAAAGLHTDLHTDLGAFFFYSLPIS